VKLDDPSLSVAAGAALHPDETADVFNLIRRGPTLQGRLI